MTEAESVLGEQAVSIEPLSHARCHTVTLEVWRVRTARRRAVVKVVSTQPLAAGSAGADRPGHPYSVGREPTLYQRGLPREFADAGITMPRLLATFDRPDAIALWLEDLDGPSAGELTVEHYAALGRRLGRARRWTATPVR